MVDLRLSTLIISIAIFSSAIIMGSALFIDLNMNYGTTINTSWSNSMNKLNDMYNSSEALYNKVSASDNPSWITSLLNTGSETIYAMKIGISSITYVPALVNDAVSSTHLPIPMWVISLILIIVLISVVYTLVNALLRNVRGGV